MFEKRFVVAMPAYNAARTLKKTYQDLPKDAIDEVLLVDDSSTDETVTLAQELGLRHIRRPKNMGCGANQKTCCREALKLRGGALRGGMPRYKYVANRFLTLIQNWLMGCKMSEYRAGYRAFSRQRLESLPLENNDNGFIFDNQMLAQAAYFGFRIGEISCPTRYFAEASSITFWPSVRYGLGVLSTAVKFRLQRWRLIDSRLFRRTSD